MFLDLSVVQQTRPAPVAKATPGANAIVKAVIKLIITAALAVIAAIEAMTRDKPAAE